MVQAQRQRRGDERPRQRGDQDGAARSARRRDRRVVRSRCTRRSVDPEHGPTTSSRRWPRSCRSTCPSCLQQKTPRATRCCSPCRLRRHQARLHGQGSPKARRRCPTRLNLRSDQRRPASASFGFHLAQYLLRRGDARVKDWAEPERQREVLHARRALAAMKNWENKVDLVSDGITQDMKMREVDAARGPQGHAAEQHRRARQPDDDDSAGADRLREPAVGQQPAGRPIPDEREPRHPGDHGAGRLQQRHLRADSTR